MNKYKKLLQNIGIFAVLNFSTKILGFLVLPFYTSYLSPEEYGTIDLINTIINLIFPILSLEIVSAVMRFGIDNSANNKVVLTSGFTVILCSIPVLWVISIIFIFVGVNIELIIFINTYYITHSFNSLTAAFAKAIDKIKEVGIVSLFTSIITLALNVIFIAVCQKGVVGYWSAMVLGQLAGFLLCIYYCRLFQYIDYSILLHNKNISKKMMQYSIPLIPNGLFWWINGSLDRWILTFYTGVGEVGLYACANKIPSIISVINNIFNQAWNISLFQNFKGDKKETFFLTVYSFYREVIFCSTIGIMLLSKVVATYMFSKEFYSAWLYIPILSAGVFYSSLNSFLGSCFTAAKKTKYIFYTTMAGAVLNFLLNIPFVYFAGAVGAALSTWISYLLVWLFRTRKIDALFGIKDNLKKSCEQLLLLIVLSALIMENKFWWLSFLIVFGYYIKLFIKNRSLIKLKILSAKKRHTK